MTTLNKKIAEILKQHPEGVPFFDALDAMVRGDMDILNQFIKWVLSSVENPQSKGIVVSGNFGNALIQTHSRILHETFQEIILVNGGIRTGTEPMIFVNELKSKEYIFLDDSFYSGTTMNKINNSLKKLGGDIIETYVVYDGSPVVVNNLYSMFRYHKELWEEIV